MSTADRVQPKSHCFWIQRNRSIEGTSPMPSGLVSICKDGSSTTSAAMQVYYGLLAQSLWCLARHYRENSHFQKTSLNKHIRRVMLFFIRPNNRSSCGRANLKACPLAHAETVSIRGTKYSYPNREGREARRREQESVKSSGFLCFVVSMLVFAAIPPTEVFAQHGGHVLPAIAHPHGYSLEQMIPRGGPL
jgi:hypothetical protein